MFYLVNFINNEHKNLLETYVVDINDPNFKQLILKHFTLTVNSQY